jgi:hypothetical protein
MRKLIVVAVGLLVFFTGWCFGKGQTATHLPGGGDWKALSSTDRELYVAGFVQGYGQGTLHAGSMAMEKLAPEKVSSMTPAQKNDYNESLGRAHKVAPILLHGVSASGLEVTASTFYADYRNTPVCFDDAIIVSSMALAGSPATEQELGAVRKRGATSGCK